MEAVRRSATRMAERGPVAGEHPPDELGRGEGLAGSLAVLTLVRRFALPPILGYLVVGMILGPNALGLASDAEAVQLLAVAAERKKSKKAPTRKKAAKKAKKKTAKKATKKTTKKAAKKGAKKVNKKTGKTGGAAARSAQEREAARSAGKPDSGDAN